MQLQGRELGMMTIGDDVKLLQQELRQLGYSIPDTEALQGFLGQNTQAAVIDFQRKHGLEPNGRVDQPTATLINRDVNALSLTFAVHGLVRHPDGKPVTGVFVAAFDKDLRSEERLGEIVAPDAEGRYEIKYAAGHFSRAEKKSADLIVRIYKDQQLAQPVLAESPIIFNAQPVETVDLVFGNQPFRGPSEFDQLLADIAPVLAAFELQPVQLTDDDVKFLSNDTGQPSERLNFLVTAHKLSDSAARKKIALSAEIFYGLFRQSLPTNVDALLGQSDEVLRNALVAAGRDNVTRELTSDEIKLILTSLKQLLVQRLLNVEADQPQAKFKSLLDTSSLTDSKLQQEFLTAYFSHQGKPEDFWKDLREKPEFNNLEGHVADLQFTLRLGVLTQSHLPLVIELKRQQQVGVVNELRDLARRDVADWKEIITAPPTPTADPLHPASTPIGFPPDTPGETDAEKIDNYAKSLARLLEDVFPTTAIAGRIEKSTLPNKTDFQTFFSGNQSFDFGTTYINNYLTDNPNALDQIEDKTGFTAHLKAMQRVYKLTPRYSEIRTLMDDGLNSASDVVRMGQSAFTAKYNSTLGGEAALNIYQNAEQMTAMALNVVANYSPTFNDISLYVLPAGLKRETTTVHPSPSEITHAATAAALGSTATLETLFGSFDLCACQECNSAHGAAAYLVDILHFLDQRKLIDKESILRDETGRIASFTLSDRSAKDELFARRPDLGEIKLTCENTNTPIPYVDLVNEILEYAVSPETAAGPPTPTEPRDRQTTLTPQELAAGPQYLNAGAYTRLSQPVYPFSLPFNLELEEARIYLGHLGVPRHELMRAFLDVANPFDPGDQTVIAIAVEHLGLSEIERQIITGRELDGTILTRPHHDWEFWGRPADSSWSKPLEQVSYFLISTGLNYQELTELITLDFITANNHDPITITAIEGEDPRTCDPTRLSLDFGFRFALLSRIHRFLRLWRKLDWTMREVDQAISVFSSTTVVDRRLDNTLLVGLSQIQTLRAELNLEVGEMLTLWSPDPAGDEGPPPRVKLLARSLGLSVSDTLAFIDLTGDPENTLEFVGAVRKIRATGFSIAQLNYLLRHQFTPSTGVAPTEEYAAQTLADVRNGLRKINDETTVKLHDETTVLTDPERDLIITEATAKELALVKQELGEVLQLDAATMDALLQHWVKSAADPAQAAIKDFLATSFVTSDPRVNLTRASFPFQFATFIRLHKVATVISKFKIAASQLIWVFDYAVDGGWLNLASLPAETGEPPASFESWEKLTDLFRLRDALPQGETAIADALNLAHSPGSGTGSGNPLEQLWRTQKTAPLLERLGVTADRCLAWAQPGLTIAVASDIQGAAKAKYDHEEWLRVAKPLRDVLREKQRAALVAYLLANPTDTAGVVRWEDVNGLYAHFLIDVEMSPCQLTSRIVQAAASVQLFVQRCLMNLESEVVVYSGADDHWLQWKWMKKFRVWEANRKIFLYPENWIAPELRDDKSPFFKELEKELLQNDVTTETAEAAFLKYLEKLDEVSRLEIVGLYQQEKQEDGDQEILHVFGRTQNSPHRYYYRRWIDQSYWTAWEKVDLDIEGDHLIPVVWNRRLYLFWPLFIEASRDVALPNAGERGSKPVKFWEIRMALSEYKSNKWSAKKTSTEAISTEYQMDMGMDSYPKERRFFFDVVPGNDLNIFCYRSYDVGTNSLLLTSWFQLDGCQGGLILKSKRELAEFTHLVEHADVSEQKILPVPTHFEFNSLVSFVEDAGDTGNNSLSLLHTVLENPGYSERSLVGYHTLLERTPGQYRLAIPLQFNQFVAQAPLVFQDQTRTFLIIPRKVSRRLLSVDSVSIDIVEGIPARARPAAEPAPDRLPIKLYQFQTFYHPYVCLFMRELNRHGTDGLLQRDIQIPQHTFDFNSYRPNRLFMFGSDPTEDVDFSHGGSHAQYNWELFFHIPLLIADRLSKNQRFEEAQKWFHYIFDPTDTSAEDEPQKYWLTRPFFETRDGYQREQIQRLLESLASGDSDPELSDQVEQWRDHPFNPHLIARLRTTAYQKTVVMKYLDNLIAWGDQLFRGDSLESINEATQLYVLAAEILGRRPEIINARETTPAHTYNSLEGRLQSGDFSDPPVAVEVENLLSLARSTFTPSIILPRSIGFAVEAGFAQLASPSLLYFCVPKNGKLLDYWNIVADRLFKIRHCMNIEGVVRQLPLFEPPIDPGLLVRAAAAGVDISSALSDINAPLPHYRFNVMSQKASELCAEVKALGAALLTALEKQDAEALALLRSRHELKLLDQIREVKSRQVEEAQRTLEGLAQAKQAAEIRHRFYSTIKFMNANEQMNLDLMSIASGLQMFGQMMEEAAAGAHASPNVIAGGAGWAGSPVALVQHGGSNAGASLQAFGRAMNMYASVLNLGANQSSILGSHQRRWDEWKLQEQLAAKEVEQINKQIVAAEIRIAIAEQELKNHDLQVENAKTVDAFMREKYTNVELYNWMVGQISGIYFQSYQLAYDVAKRAERAYLHELGLADSSFIQFGYWDSLKKGLLAGERLYHDIKRLEVAYLDQNKRELELTRHVSLRQLNPLALLTLKATGTCEVTVPEWLYDRDCPGHYMRRIKNVALSIPSVVGPYTSVNCTLSLLRSTLRKSPVGEYARQGREDSRFVDYIGAVQSIVTSTGSNDSGLFETNLRDERFLPFEGAGADSTWNLDLPADYRAFDYATISDVILHIRYTARQGVDYIKVKESLDSLFAPAAETPPLALLFSLRHDFPTDWSAFVNGTEEELTVTIRKDYFPYFAQGKTITITGLELYAPDGTNPPRQHTLDEAAATRATADLVANQAFPVTAAPNEVLTRTAKAQVFLIIRYSL